MSSINPIAATPPATSPTNGWRGVALVAITYIYFLIFAQFAFLQRLAQLHIADAHLKAVMAAMAFGGILFSRLTPRTEIFGAPRARLQLALTLSAAAALLTLLPLNLPAAIAVAFLIGAFVLSTGLACFYGAWLTTPPLYAAKLEVVWLLTAITRATVALFVFTQVFTGTLESGWLTVVLSDGIIALIQFTGLARGWLTRGWLRDVLN